MKNDYKSQIDIITEIVVINEQKKKWMWIFNWTKKMTWARMYEYNTHIHKTQRY